MRTTAHCLFADRIARCGALALVLGGLTLAQPVGAESSDGDPKNAATWYGRSIAAWQKFKQSSPQHYDLVTNYAGDPSAPITPEIRAAVLAAQGAIGDFRKGSQQEYCDFALDYSQGFELMLPHLGEMRGIARAMRADATIRLADGDASGAAAELASMYKTSGHFGDDRVLISSLVGQAVFSFADAGVQNALDRAAFNPADAAALLSGVKPLGDDDPFQYIESQAMEQEIALATLEKYRGPEGMHKLLSMMGGDGGAALAQEIGALDDAGFDAALSQYDQVMSKMSAAFSITDKDAAIAEAKKIEESIAAGEFGLLAKALAPAHSKILERKFAGEQMIADRIATLSKLASGEQKPEEVANAALWYLRAIDMWEALPRETRITLLAAAVARDAANAGDASAVEQFPQSALLEIQPIIDVVREASIKRRCDFAAFVRHRGPPAIAPHYAPGLHELLLTLRTDGRRLLSIGDQAGAVDRFATALRATAHLGGDVNLAVCRSAHVHFNAIIELLEAAQSAGALDVRAPAAAPLADAAGRVSRKDPFGYESALKKARDDVITRFSINPERQTEQDVQHWGQQMTLVRSFNADQTMVMLILLDERNRRLMANALPAIDGAPEPEHDYITLPETVERLRGVFDPDATAAVRATYDEISQRFSSDDFEIFRDNPATPVARLNEGLARARGDLRRATSLLMLPDEIAAEVAPGASKPQP